MPDNWTMQPPAPCHRTGKDEPNGGPYFVEDHYTADVKMTEHGPRVFPRIRPLVHSSSFIRRILESPGSPYAAVTVQSYEHLKENEARLTVELEAAEDRIRELEAEVETLRESQTSIDVEALAGALIVPLRQQLSKPPKRAA